MEYDHLIWACRRGMLELDLLLKQYLERGYPSASPEERLQFIQLLACEDQELARWLTQSADIPQSYEPIVHRVLEVNAKCNHSK